MWITVAKDSDVKVLYHPYLNRACMLTSGRHPCYAPTPIEVILFEDRPDVYEALQVKVNKWHNGPRVKG